MALSSRHCRCHTSNTHAAATVAPAVTSRHTSSRARAAVPAAAAFRQRRTSSRQQAAGQPAGSSELVGPQVVPAAAPPRDSSISSSISNNGSSSTPQKPPVAASAAANGGGAGAAAAAVQQPTRAAADPGQLLSNPQQQQQQQSVALPGAAAPDSTPQPPKSLAVAATTTSSTGSSSSKPDTGWYYAVGLSAIAALICSVDRAAISVAILPMSEQFGWSDSTKGAINSAFYVGYTITNLVGGYLASSLSAKQVLGWGVVLWSIFTITTPPAASASLPILLANRAVMGAGEGVTFPCVQNIVKGWVPADTRTRALTLIYSGGQLGTITALITAPLIIKGLGWPAVFVIYGSLGLFWNLAWQKLVADYPPLLPLSAQSKAQQAATAAAAAVAEKEAADQPAAAVAISQQQLAQPSALPAASSQQQQQQLQQAPQRLPPLPRVRDLPWKQFFTNKAFLAIVMAHSAFGVGHYVCLSWLPSYYNQEFGVDVQQSALLSVLPWFVTVLVSNSSGWIADGLSNSGTLTMTQTRKLLQVVGSVGPAFCLLYLAQAHSDPRELGMGEAVGLLTATLSIGGFQSAGFASNHQDISSRYAAVLFGITNALSSLMGTFSVYATGLILESTHSWTLVFQLVAAFYLAGAVAFMAWASAEQQFE